MFNVFIFYIFIKLKTWNVKIKLIFICRIKLNQIIIYIKKEIIYILFYNNIKIPSWNMYILRYIKILLM